MISIINNKLIILLSNSSLDFLNNNLWLINNMIYFKFEKIFLQIKY